MKRELIKALEVPGGEQMQLLSESSFRVRKFPKSGQSLTYPGEIVFAEKKSAVTVFTCFIPDERRNAFTIELEWSLDGKFPQVTARPSLQPKEALSDSICHGFVRLSEFYSRLGEDWDVAPIVAGILHRSSDSWLSR